MQAIRVHHFGGLDALIAEDVPRPVPGDGEVLLRVRAAGVGPWDAWIRSGRSVLSQPLPLTLGSDVAGRVEQVGSGVSRFKAGEAVFGATNSQFTGGYAEYAVATAAKLAKMPSRIGFIEAASVPVVACTAWQMVFEYGAVDATKRVLVHGGAGNVGAYAVQLAKRVARDVVATALTDEVEYVKRLGADRVIDVRKSRFEELIADVDVVLDTVGGDTQDRSFAVLRRGGILVSAVAAPDQERAAHHGVRAVFFLVDVSSSRLEQLAALIDAGDLIPCVGDVLPLSAARTAHEMLAGKPHRRGKIVLTVDGLARHWIDGRWRDSAVHNDSISPATGETIGRYALAGQDEAREATAAALRAFCDADWRNDRARRSRVLHEMAARFEARAADLIQLLSLETGKIVPEAAFEVGMAAPALRYYGALALTEHGRASEWEAGHFSLLVREPIGVAGISVPWNAPVALLIRALAPALAAGCTTVVKMPGKTAQINALISDVISEVASLPQGVVNIVTGEREVLSFLVESPDVPAISFTGSTRVGRAISQSGAARLKRFGLELGGKTPMLVFDDADLEAALPKLEKAVTVFAGQFCMTGSRLLVQSGVASAVRRQLAERLANVRVGPASDPASDMGPMIDKDNVERVNRMVEDAIAGGARVIVRGGPAPEAPLASGAFYRPTLLEVKDSRLPIVQEEVFGPVLTMQVFDTEAEAIALANDSEYGLAASIWTRDVDRPLRVGRDLQVGTVWVNDWVMMRDEFEEGGYKQSGRGRLRGLAALDDFLEYKHFVLKPGVVSDRRA